MSEVSLEEFAKAVRPEVPGCPEPIIHDAILSAADRFCVESRVWLEGLGPFDVFANIGEYELIASYPAEVIRPISVAFNGIPIVPISFEYLETSLSGWRDISAKRPTSYFMATARRLRLYPKPDADAEGIVGVSAELRPAGTATELPRWLLSDHRLAIENGALGRLLAMGRRSWSNPEKAAVADRWFGYYINQAKRHRMGGFANVPLRAQMRPFV